MSDATTTTTAAAARTLAGALERARAEGDAARAKAAASSAVQTTLSIPRFATGYTASDRTSVLTAALEEYRASVRSPAAGAARAYLIEQRGIDRRAAEAAGVGYLPPVGAERDDAFVARMLARGFTPDALVDAGIAHSWDTECVSAHSLSAVPAGGGYLTLPVRTPDGTLIGFKYRAVPGETRENALRYTGTTGSVGAAMFGADRIPAACREVLAVEGEIDQLSCEAARLADPTIGYTLALHGKEITDARLRHLAGAFDRVTMMLDADEGGWDGILRGGRKLGAAGVVVDILPPPAEQDPNDILRVAGPDGLARAIHFLPRVSLLEAHAKVLVARGIAATEPVFTARELVETAAMLPDAVVARDPGLYARVAALSDLPVDAFDGVAALRAEYLAANPTADAAARPAARVSDVAATDANALTTSSAPSATAVAGVAAATGV